MVERFLRQQRLRQDSGLVELLPEEDDMIFVLSVQELSVSSGYPSQIILQFWPLR